MSIQNQVVYIVDDDPAIRESIEKLLRAEGLRVQTYPSATEFLVACDAKTRGCLLLDIRMPQMSGIELQSRLADRGVPIPIIFLTGMGDIPTASLAFRAGALDFLEKPFDIDTLLARIRQALSRDAEQWHGQYRQKLLQESCAKLSPREKQVLKWVAAGYSSKEIANAMGISNRTVEVHRAHIMEKVQAQSLADLITIALEWEKLPHEPKAQT